MKEGIRVLGIDDSPFSHSDSDAFLTGVVYRGTEFAEDVRRASIEVDAENATEKVVELHNSCSNTRQIKAVLVDGISLAGFNIVDLEEAAERLDKPVIAVTSNKPRPEKFREAMEKSGNYDRKFDELPEYSEVEMDEGKCFIQYAGTGRETAEQLIRETTLHGLTPEAIRLADMIGKAFSDSSG
jgi:endonuclease V-like protein UPF0215 family